MASYRPSESESESDQEWWYPKFPRFYGDDNIDSIKWRTFKFNIEATIQSDAFTHSQILLGVRQALRGKAHDLVRRLGVGVTLKEVITHLDSAYSSVESRESVLAKFYAIRQEPCESVLHYTGRCEEVFDDAVELGGLKRSDQHILKNVMYQGLNRELKYTVMTKFEMVPDYDMFKVELRRLESEMAEDRAERPDVLEVNANCNATTTIEEDIELSELKSLVEQLNERIAGLEREKMQQQIQSQSSYQNYSKDNRNGYYHYRYLDHRYGDGRYRKGYRHNGYRYNQSRNGYRQDRNSYKPRRPTGMGTFQPICYNCHYRGHIAANCPRQKICAPVVRDQTMKERKEPELVGETNEVEVDISNVRTRALLDTGSCVSVIAERFYKEHLSSHQIQPLKQILSVECADGENLPYLGYVEADLSLKCGVPNAKTQTCLFLVSPDTNYSTRTPVIIGTNILNEVLEDCKQNYGEQFLQKANLKTPWYVSFKCMVVREKELKRNKDRLAVIRSGMSEKVIIRPNETVNIVGFTDKQLQYAPTTALIHESEESKLSPDIDITPGIVNYEFGKTKEVTIELSNITTNTVSISPREIICELQPVTISEYHITEKEEQDPREAALNQVHIDVNDKLDKEQRAKIDALLRAHIDIFATSDTDIGQCDRVKHKIELLPEYETPLKQQHRRIPPHMVDEVRQHLHQLLSAGIIRRSKSPWASPVVLVRKKNGKLRMCVDYRLLNQRTIKDAYALPRIEEVFDVLSGSRYFSTIDMKAGYHQVEVEDTHKERTAFTVGPMGFYEYVKMPFGLSNSPATYQRLMEDCLGELNMSICIIYLDDLIIFSRSFKEHLERIDIVLTRLKENKLKLSPEKCFFVQEKVNFLGHVVSDKGVETDPMKIEKVRKWPTPKNADELRSFLAFAGYYRRYIKDFSRITRPLSDLLPPTTTKKGPKKKKDHKEWRWTEVEDDIFEDLKKILTAPPILAYPDFTCPFELHTDASTKGLGAVLYQEQEGRKRVIAYASRSLTKSEKNYPAFKLEFLALKWAVTEKFKDYLAIKHFTVLTDSNPLTYILTSAKLDATGQRWAAALGNFNFDLYYRAGLRNGDADGMSRLDNERADVEDEERVKMDQESVKTICGAMTQPVYVETIPACEIDIVEITEEPGVPMAQVELLELRRSQRQDPTIERWRKAVIDKTVPNMNLTKGDIVMKRSYKNLNMKRGILYRNIEVDGKTIEQLVVPERYRTQILKGLHTDVGHPGKERTLRLLRERFFWPGMTADAEQYVSRCTRCLRRKTHTNMRAPLVSVTTTYPLELVCMDFLTLEPSKGGIANVLVITDHFTKFATAIPTRNQTAKTTAEALYNNFILNYGIPTRIHSDQGANFESEIVKELCELTGMTKSRTTIYHPMGNGIPERFNRTLLDMLGTLENHQKDNWKKYVPSLVYAYNCTPHESTNSAPFELMFGRRPQLPIDTVFRKVTEGDSIKKDTREYIADLKDRMAKTQDIVKKHLEKSRSKQKKNFDRKAKAAKISVGDKVLVKIVRFEGKHKIQDRFEEEVYDVIDQPRMDIPVFKLRSRKSKVEKTLHRNHLFPVDYQDEPDEEDDDIEEVPKEQDSSSRTLEEVSQETKSRIEETDASVANQEKNIREESSASTESSESEQGYGFVTFTKRSGDAHVRPDSNVVSTETMSDRRVEAVDDTDNTGRDEPQVENRIDSREDQIQGNMEHDRTDTATRRKLQEEVAIEVTRMEDTGRSRDSRVENGQFAGSVRTADHLPRIVEEPIVENPMNDSVATESETETEGGCRRRILPRVPLRRSTRPHKAPDRYDPCQMKQMVTVKDSKLQALEEVMRSGILNKMDVGVAHKLVEAIMK